MEACKTNNRKFGKSYMFYRWYIICHSYDIIIINLQLYFKNTLREHLCKDQEFVSRSVQYQAVIAVSRLIVKLIVYSNEWFGVFQRLRRIQLSDNMV